MVKYIHIELEYVCWTFDILVTYLSYEKKMGKADLKITSRMMSLIYRREEVSDQFRVVKCVLSFFFVEILQNKIKKNKFIDI